MSVAATASGSPRLDKYELLEEIGHGGMATVYRALDSRLGREVAVKIIHRHLRENAEVGTRFVAEARAAAKLRHPAIVDVYDVSDEDDPERYLVVELVRGTTLRRVLQQHRDMPAEVGAAIVQHICGAVEHAHASSIVHRDIKPENVLVELPCDRAACAAAGPPSSAVVIKITDFGIAKILDAQGVTSTGQVLGSPAHMAPEQIEGGDVDPRTDVFALGVLLYECLVGHLPFEGKNPAQVLRRVLDGEYAPADRERPSVGGRWARIVASALAREPAERTASAKQLGEQIQAELSALGVPDGRVEISAYFAEPDAYIEAHHGLLVPRLTARGEAARKAGDVWGAAADWNRALALAPADLTLLKRMASLTSSASRKDLLRRAGTILAGSAALGLCAFAVARSLKAHPADRDGALPSSTAAVAPAAPPLAALITAEPEQRPMPLTVSSATSGGDPPNPQPVTRVPHVLVTTGEPPKSPAQLATPAVREVKFVIKPMGAILSIDGAVEKRWFTQTIPLSVGPHAIEVTPTDERCCTKKVTVIQIEPPPGPVEAHATGRASGGEQSIFLSMELKPTVVGLSASAPPGARLACQDIGLSVIAGVSTSIRLREIEWTGPCAFIASDRARRMGNVSLKAGEAKSIPWLD